MMGAEEGQGSPEARGQVEGLTIGGRSGNSFAGASRTASPLRENGGGRREVPTEAMMAEMGEGMQEEDRFPGWEEEEARVREIVEKFEQEDANAIAASYWKEPSDAYPVECRVMKVGGDRRKSLIVYFPHGEGRTATLAEWKWARIRAAVARRTQRTETVVFPWPWKNAIQTALSREIIRTGRPMTLLKWGKMFRLLHPESRANLWAEFTCTRCQQVRRVEATATEALMGAAMKEETVCEMVGGSCGQNTAERILPWMPHKRLWDKEEEDAYHSPRHEEDGKGRSRMEGKVLGESWDDEDYLDDSTSAGFSSAAMRFYKATGKAIPLPDFSGTSSEAAFLAWRRGVERHFATYGIERENERVMVAAEMLSGEAKVWWDGVWMSNREKEVQSWEELRKRLRMRFLPPEGEMKVVGQWRRLQQTGTVAAYTDYVYRLQAMCSMQQGADFKLAFYGLRPELQGEVRKYMRQRELQTLSLERLFEVASDAEVGLGKPWGKKEGFGGREDKGRQGTEKANGWGAGYAKVNQLTSGANGWGRNSDRGRDQGEKMGGWKMANSTSTNSYSERGWRRNTEGRSKNEFGPCAVCDGFGHGWMTCSKRKSGKGCARCGSTAHLILNCPLRRKMGGKNGMGNQDEGKWKGVKDTGWGGTCSENKDDDDLLVCNLGVSLPCSVSGLPRTQLLTYEVRVGKDLGEVMLDSGATVNAISQYTARRIGEPLRPSCEKVRFADGREGEVKGEATIRIDSKGHAEKVTGVVLPGMTSDILLGRPWLSEWNPTIDWATGELTFSDGIVWKPKTGMRKDQQEKEEGRRRWRQGEKQKRAVYQLELHQIQTKERTEDGGREQPNKEIVLPLPLKTFKDVFEPPGECQPLNPPVEHRLRLAEKIDPIRKVPYRMAPKQKDALQKELTEFKDKGWIRPSSSPWATVALVVPKKDGTWRVCIDYRDLNAATKMDAYPLPRIDELLHRLAKARVFSKVDLHSGFHQIPMEKESIPLTAFRVPEPVGGCSHFEWTVMPMGLSTAPPTFQRWMERSLQGLEHCTLVYLDDVLIYSQDGQQHWAHLKEVFGRFQQRGMRLKLKKCVFAVEVIPFLGHWISDGCIQVDEDKLGRLKEWEAPLANIKQVRQFVGFVSYYRTFIPAFAEMVAPLTGLLKKTKEWRWTEEATKALQSVKAALLEARKRYAWDPQRSDRVTTDASDVGLGASFEQKVEGTGWVPVAFWSRKLSGAELNYSVTDKEWLAVVEAVTRHWRHWLMGRRFILRSDHAALKQLLRVKGEQFTSRQARWADRLSEFAYEFEHIPGPSNAVADALSRAPIECISALELRVGLSQKISPEEIGQAASQDEEYQRRKLQLLQNDQGDKRYLNEEGLIKDDRGRVRIPKEEALRIKLILEAHEPPFCGHLGVRRTMERVQQEWTWEGLREDVEKVVRACDVCQRDGTKRQSDKAPLITIVASRPWEVVTMDFLCGLTPSSPGGWTGCVVVCDRFSRMMHVKECASHPTAEEAARLFIYLVISRHGMPVKVISDRGTQFESVLWHEVIERMGTRVALATTHHPQTNGITERANRTLLQMIRRVCAGRGSAWVKWLPLMELAYNSSIHSITRVSPFFVNYGYHPKLPASFLSSPGGITEGRDPQEAVTGFCRKLQQQAREVWEQVSRLSATAGRQAEARENQVRGQMKYQPGEEVLCYQFHMKREGEEDTRKQLLKYAGPFVVKEVSSKGWVELAGLPPQAPTRYNIEYIKPYKRCLTAEPWREVIPPPRPEVDDEGIRWEVERILGQRGRRKGKQFLVKWVGFAQPTWEREENLDRCAEALREFRERSSSSRQ